MQSVKQRRFEALLSGRSHVHHDQPLLDGGSWLVAPTLGAVTPGWLLALPREAALSFRDWNASGGESALFVLGAVTEHLGLRSDEVLWFEHGPAVPGTSVGCGLDHAHLHILVRPPFGFAAFVDHVQAADLGWTETCAATSYSGLTNISSYLVAGSGDRAITAVDVEAAGSQFFRRTVAALVGSGAEWDYRTSAHLPNIERTVAEFRRLENVARRDV